MSLRYAIYFAPAPEQPLWRFGSAVLGYDAATGRTIVQRRPASTTAADWRALTEAPRRYGFHATLKAPFHLAEGASEEGLIGTVREFARTAVPFNIRLRVSCLGAFAALTPIEVPPALAALEGAVVRAFDGFRAPPAEGERARRMASPLSARQQQLFEDYGYPYVLDEFRFHMTLTGPLSTERAAGIIAWLQHAFEATCRSETSIDRIAVFCQHDSRFRILENIRLG